MAAVVGPRRRGRGDAAADGRGSLVAVSGHDSTPYTMRRFAAAFGPGFRQVQVGEEIRVDGRS
jgi:hypothetical protein